MTKLTDGAGQVSSADPVLAIKFVAEAGKQMLESSSSVSEVLEYLRGFLPAVGLRECSIDATLSTLTLSYWKAGEPAPFTLVREVEVAEPRLERLSGTTALLDRVERGEIDLASASEQLRHLAKAPPRRRLYTRVALLVSVLGWVLFLDGLTVLTVLVALLATVLTFPVDALVQRLRLPGVAGVFLAAAVLAATPNLLAGAGLGFSLSAAVVGGLFPLLPGRPFVSAVIDGLSNAPLSAMARGLESLTTAGALALGVLLGGRIGAGLGVELQADTTSAPLVVSVLGAGLGVLGLATAWGMPRTRLVPAAAIGAGGWFIVASLSRGGSGSGWPLYLIAATFVGAAGLIAAKRQGEAASVYTGVAILPLVPGFSLYQGMLLLTQGPNAGAGDPLRDAGIIGLAIAGGSVLGITIGRNIVTAGYWFTRRRKGPHAHD